MLWERHSDKRQRIWVFIHLQIICHLMMTNLSVFSGPGLLIYNPGQSCHVFLQVQGWTRGLCSPENL